MALDADILKALRGGPLTTTQLAERLDELRSRILKECKELESEKKIKRTKIRLNKKLLYCIDHEEVVNAEIYAECDEEDHELRYFYPKVPAWTLA